MYPLNVSLPAPGIGFAVANDEDEHERLTAAGYVPKLEKLAEPVKTSGLASADEDDAEAVRAKLRELGIAFHPNTGLAKLKALLPE